MTSGDENALMKKNTHLVFFDSHYPFGHGEEFIEDEMRVAETCFDRISIVSLAKPPLITTEYVPKNAKVFPVRKHYKQISVGLIALKCLFMKRFYVELARGIKERGFVNTVSVVMKIILSENIISILEKNDYKWIDHSFSATYFYSFWLDSAATYLCRNKQRLDGYCFSRAHGGDCFYNRGFHAYRQKQLELLDAIFPISEIGRLDLIEQGLKLNMPSVDNKVITQRLGLNKPSSVLNPNSTGGSFFVVSCSNVIPLKRLDLIIGALASIDDIDITWKHFGNGSLLQEIKTMADSKLSKKTNIHYSFEGYQKKENIFAFYETTSISLFINCSDVEGIPVSIMEAMAYGIPVIARNVGGNSEIVEDGINGVLLPALIEPNNLADAIKRIISLYSDQNSIKTVRENAYQTYLSKYSIQNYFRFYDLIKKRNYAN